MPLAPVANGQQTDASQLDQFVNLLTGVMNDQPVTLKGDNTRAPSLLTLDSVNAAQVVSLRYADAGPLKWQLYKSTDNHFAIYDQVKGADVFSIGSNGGMVLAPAGDVTIGGTSRLIMSAAVSKIVPGATSLSLRNNADSADNLIITDAGNATLRGGLQHTTPYKARAYIGAASQSIASGAWAKVSLDTKDFDLNTNFDVVTNHYWTCPVTGYYLFTGTVSHTATTLRIGIRFNRNNGTIIANALMATTANGAVISLTAIEFITAGDTVQMDAYQETGGSLNIVGGSNVTWMGVHYLSS